MCQNILKLNVKVKRFKVLVHLKISSHLELI